MANDDNLFNATVVGENLEAGFLVEGKRLHAVEKTVAALKKDKARPEVITPLIRDALKALIKYAEGKVPPHFLRIDWNSLTGSPDEQKELIYAIGQIYNHLPHHDRNQLSTLVHHTHSN